MPVKLVVCDVDGTLIGDDRRLTEDIDRLGAIIASCRIPFTIASGRIPSRIEELAKRLHISLPYIGCNGACAVRGDSYLWNDFILPEYLKPAMELADRLGMSIVYTDGIHELAYRKTPWVADLMDKYNRYDGVFAPGEEEWPAMRIQKVLIAGECTPASGRQVLQKLLPFENRLHIVEYEDGVLDITTKSSSKEEGVRRLAAALHIPMEEVLAIGDHQNDIGMIRCAGTGAAVANASEELKREADYVCSQRIAKGVIEAVERFCLSGEESR